MPEKKMKKRTDVEAEKLEEKKQGEKTSLRGRVFRGIVIRKFQNRVCIEFERTIYIKKYERYTKKKTKIHARLPESMAAEINLGDYIEMKECRPLSKIIHFIVTKKIKDPGEKK